MARTPEELARLAKEFASLTRGERELVIAEAKKKRFKPLPKDWEPPTLAGGTQWVGGSLSREELYGDDGR